MHVNGGISSAVLVKVLGRCVS